MMKRELAATLTLTLFLIGVSGCGVMHGHKTVTLDQVDPAARTVIDTYTKDSNIDEIHTGYEDGHDIYKVHYKKNGRENELQVTSKGAVLEWEEAVTMEELPAAVNVTVTRITHGATIKELVKEVEESDMFYEVEFDKDGKENEVKIAEDGSILEWETE